MRAFRCLSFFWLFVGFMGVFFVPASVQAAFTPWNQIVETRLIERVQSQHPPLTSEEKLSLWGAYEKFLTLEYFIQEKHINVIPMPAMGQRTPDQTAYAYLQPYAAVLKRTHAPGFFVLQDIPAVEAYETLLASLYQRDQGNLQQATNAYLKTHWTLEMRRKEASVAVLKEIKKILQLQKGVAAPAFTPSILSPQASASPQAPWSVVQKKMGRREKAFFSGGSDTDLHELLSKMTILSKKLQRQKEADLVRYQKEYQQALAAKKAQHLWQIEHTTLEVRSLQESLEMVQTLEKQQQNHMPLIGRFEKSPLFKSEAKVASKKPAWGLPAQAAAVVVADQEGVDECWFTSVAADKARIRPALIDYIDNEQGGISAALYRLRERNVINALINLRQQHKKVRILLVLDVDALQPGTQEKLERFGIDLFFYQDTDGGLMHDKIYIFQKNTRTKGPVLITGSANSTQAALQGENLESFVIRNKREIVAAYQQQILDVQGLSQAAAEE